MERDIQLFWKRIKPTYNPRWSILELAKGDIGDRLKQYQRYFHTMKRKDGIHSVLWVRNADIERWREANSISHIRHCIGSVLGDEDGRMLFPTIYRKADDEKKRRKELATDKKKNKIGKVILPPCILIRDVV